MTVIIEENLRLGGDPRSCTDFDALRAELAKLKHPACPDVDWPGVERLCLALFREQGLELQSVAAFALARAQLHGLDGMGDGLRLLNWLVLKDWEQLWPPALPARLEILAWLFTQLQPLLRRQDLAVAQLQALSGLDDELCTISEWLAGQLHVPLAPLQALRNQLHGAMRRLGCDEASGAPGMGKPALRVSLEAGDREVANVRTGTGPTVVVLKLDAVEPNSSPGRRKRTVWPWLLALTVLIGLTGLFGWWMGAASLVGLGDPALATKPPATPAPPQQTIRLDSLALFPPGRAELKPESTKVLINRLINIKAQPGWLIVITGHSDATGDAQRNMALSHARAAAVRDWMQRMGDIPDSCFVVRGAGASEPIVSNDTEEGRGANRRVEISLIPAKGACEKG